MAEVESRALPSNLNNYIALFSDGVIPQENKERIARAYYRYVEGSNSNAVAPFAQVEEDPNRIDTALEWLYASYYHVAVRDIRPPEADAILPANNPRLVDQIIGAETFREIQIARFLGNTAAVGRYAGGLKFITDRRNVTQAEIETYYRNGIGALVSQIVDEEFNKVSFFIENIINSRANSYNGVLTRNPQTGQYTLRYEDARDITKELSVASLEALSTAMRNSGDFVPAAIDTVRAQAALIPAVARPGELERTKTAVTNFFLTPNNNTYNVMTSLYNTYVTQPYLRGSFLRTVEDLNPALAMRIIGR